MRGQRAPLNENSDGKVDESFWAVGLATSGDEGGIPPPAVQQTSL